MQFDIDAENVVVRWLNARNEASLQFECSPEDILDHMSHDIIKAYLNGKIDNDTL